ncbi:MAG: CDP-diacylglycerol--serine O-phosphatidyltransferase [bacterium]|nr:CDP-diacylglycerol--serine O-phosphatidyltransferase [bacterium]
MRKVYILPNLFTAASLLAGMLAIFEVFGGDPKQACWLIAIAAILDVFDGAIARLTRTASAFGMNFDSLADLVAFGVAPALLTYDFLSETSPGIATGVCGLYAICGALRLARFNVQAMREERKTFLGLPIPGAALAVMALAWIFANERTITTWIPYRAIAPPFIVVIAYLMVSKVPYKGFKSIPLAGRQPFEILVTMIVIAFLLFILKHYLDLVLAAVSWSYILVGVALYLSRRDGLRDAHAGASLVPKRPEPPDNP